MAKRRSAGPPADVMLAKLDERLRSGSWAPGLTVLTGDDLYHLDAAQQRLLDALVPEGSSDFALTVFADEKVDVSKVVAAARSRGMFATCRVVLVRDVDVLDGDPAPLEAYAQSPPDASFLLVRAPALDQRRKLHKILAGAGTLVPFSMANADPAGLERVVKKLGSDRGLRLDGATSAFVLDASGGDLNRVGHELDKLATWLGPRAEDPVRPEQAREVIPGTEAMSGWEVADAVLVRDGPGAVAAARKLVEAGEEPIRILGGLAYRVRTMLQAKALLDGGASRRDVVTRARAWSYERKLLGGLDRYRLEELLRVPALLLDADRTFKSRSLDAGAVLEGLLRNITGTAQTREGARR